ncbi:Glutamate-gated chloride channel, partial [Orchesella cincta]
YFNIPFCHNFFEWKPDWKTGILPIKSIWKPEVYFPNAKEADFQFVTVPNVLVRINPDGVILYMLRLRVTFSCMMDLSKFPLDRQTCTMEVASFSKTVEELILAWKEDNPVTTGNLGMSQFELVAIVTDRCQESFQIGNYSCLVAEFHLSRSLGFHLVQSYLPTILMVVISWVSFWMDVNSVPGRVTLGVTTLLTVSSKATNIQENLPQASYVKAIDVWMGTCTAFVFLALLEFTVVNYLWRKECCRNFRRARAYSPDAITKDLLDGQDNDKPPSPCNTLVKECSTKENKIHGWENKFCVTDSLLNADSDANTLFVCGCDEVLNS